jgi:4-amino-4-deoxy-L-arabinose transferase-like glycosyltransferase
MREIAPLSTSGWIGLLFVILFAAGTRIGYLLVFCDGGVAAPILTVQGASPGLEFEPGTELRDHEQPTEFDNLVHNLRESRWFGGLAPLADREERTAHIAPGYFWLASWSTTDADIRRVQTGLSIATVILVFFLARYAFGSDGAASIVGLIAALFPFWIVAEGELADGTLATFLLAAALFCGTLASRTGGPAASVLFGLSLAGLALVRAAMLPFSFVALGWFLFRCRGLRLGWFSGLLALLGFANGLAPWAVRNFNAYQSLVPVANSAYLHLWIGNASAATGGPVDEKTLRTSLPAERVKELVDEPNQAKRYASLGRDVARQVIDDPAGTVSRRIGASLRFLLGETWFQKQLLVDRRPGGDQLPTNDWQWVQFAHHLALFGVLILAAFGWRWSHAVASDVQLLTLAFVFVPLPYILAHAGTMSGPRLPWDVPLIAFAGFAVAWRLGLVQPTENLSPAQIKHVIQDASTRHL